MQGTQENEFGAQPTTVRLADAPEGAGTCPTCNPNGIAQLSFVYALGRIAPRFPSLSIEKEFAQASGQTDAAGKTNNEVLRDTLARRENRYLLRQLCWVFTVEGLPTFILQPRDPSQYETLIESVRPTPSPMDIDLIVGIRGPLAPATVCNGLVLPLVAFSHLYSFDRNTLVDSIPKPEKIAANKFRAAASELFATITQIADNAGSSDEHRALNYLTVRYPAIYAKAASCLEENLGLSRVDVRVSSLSGARKIVDVVFSYTHRQTDVTEKHFCRVDVTEEFPFLVTKLSPYFDR